MTLFARNRGLLLALASGIVFASVAPPTNFALGILLGMIGLACAFACAEGARRAAWTGFSFGLGANLIALRFVPIVIARFTTLPTPLGWIALVLLAVAQSLPWAACGAVLALVRRRTRLPFALAVGMGTYAATFVPAVFPWTPAGGLSTFPTLVQTAELVGERGTTFVLSVACGLFATAIVSGLRQGLRAARTPFILGMALFAALATFGLSRIRSVEARRSQASHARVALLQPDFDAMVRWQPEQATMMLERLTVLTKNAERSGADLTIWPESAYPYTLPHGVSHQPIGAHAVLQFGVRGPVLTGAYLAKGGGLGTNSAILVERGGAIGPSYDKRHLLWFGETVPLADVFPFLRRIFARGTGLEPGTAAIAFHAGPIVASVLLCYEDTLPAAGREAMEARPNLLVNVTNDAWFAETAESELHLRLAVLRAIETRRDLVRSVNRGPTSWVSASGQVLSRQESAPGLGASPPLLADVALLDEGSTLYSGAGDLPLVALLSFVLIMARERSRKSQATPH